MINHFQDNPYGLIFLSLTLQIVVWQMSDMSDQRLRHWARENRTGYRPDERLETAWCIYIPRTPLLLYDYTSYAVCMGLLPAGI